MLLLLLLLLRLRLTAQVLTLAGELLGNAEVLLRDGLHTAEIADGYQRAADKVQAGMRGAAAEAAEAALQDGRTLLLLLLVLAYSGVQQVSARPTLSSAPLPCKLWSHHSWLCCVHACVLLLLMMTLLMAAGAAGAGRAGPVRHGYLGREGQSSGACVQRGLGVGACVLTDTVQ